MNLGSGCQAKLAVSSLRRRLSRLETVRQAERGWVSVCPRPRLPLGAHGPQTRTRAALVRRSQPVAGGRRSPCVRPGGLAVRPPPGGAGGGLAGGLMHFSEGPPAWILGCLSASRGRAAGAVTTQTSRTRPEPVSPPRGWRLRRPPARPQRESKTLRGSPPSRDDRCDLERGRWSPYQCCG